MTLSAVNLQLFPILGKGKKTSDELVEVTKADPVPLGLDSLIIIVLVSLTFSGRLLRYLAAFGAIEEIEQYSTLSPSS